MDVSDEPPEVLDLQKAEEEYQNGVYRALSRAGSVLSGGGLDHILGAVLAVRDAYVNALCVALSTRLEEIDRMRPAYSAVVCGEGHHTRTDELLGDPNSADWICPHCFIRADESQRERWSFPGRWVGDKSLSVTFVNVLQHRWIWVKRTEDDILVCKACKRTGDFVELFSPCEAFGQ